MSLPVTSTPTVSVAPTSGYPIVITGTIADETSSYPVTTPSPAGGTFSSSFSVTLTASKPSTIHYTTDGSTPTEGSPVYSSPIPIVATTTLRFFAHSTDGYVESVQTQVYTIADVTPPMTTASPTGEPFTDSVTVTLSVNKPAVTYYTTDGSTPSTSSSMYVLPLVFTESTVLKYFSRDSLGNTEVIRAQTYTKTGAPPPPPSNTGGLTITLADGVTVADITGSDGVTKPTITGSN